MFTVTHYIEYVLVSLILVFGTVGNICVIHMHGFTEERHHAGSKLVVALAATDFLSSILIPVDAMTWITQRVRHPDAIDPPYPHSVGVCFLLKSVSPLFMMASSWLLTAVSIERVR